MAADMLFATLDPTMREIRLPEVDKAILSDTVGFISNLPTELVAAFRATLEEVTTADLIAHVRDMSHPDSEAQFSDVETILSDLGVTDVDGEGGQSIPRIELWNKIDQCDAERRVLLIEKAASRNDVVLISALTGEGLEQARQAIGDRLTRHHVAGAVIMPAQQGDALAWLHAHGRVVRQRETEEGAEIAARLAPSDWDRFAVLWPQIRIDPT